MQSIRHNWIREYSPITTKIIKLVINILRFGNKSDKEYAERIGRTKKVSSAVVIGIITKRKMLKIENVGSLE